jgi:hypothetical protein
MFDCLLGPSRKKWRNSGYYLGEGTVLEIPRALAFEFVGFKTVEKTENFLIVPLSLGSWNRLNRHENVLELMLKHFTYILLYFVDIIT